MADYTTTALLTSIKNRGMIPTSQQTFLDPDIINLANEELQIGVVPLMLKLRSEYFATPIDIPILPNVGVYPLPSRAIGGKIRGLALIDASGNVLDIPQIEKEERTFFNGSSGSSFVFYFEGNNAVLVPKPTSDPKMTLRVTYYQRPNQLVANTAAAQITAIAGTQLTVSFTPAAIASGALVDLINGTPGFDCRAIDQAVASVSGSVITLGSTPPSTLATGDWVALAQQSPIPQIPVELHSLLAQRTMLKILEALGDNQSVQVAQAKMKEMEEATTHLLSPRSDSNPKKLINRYSTLRSRISR